MRVASHFRSKRPRLMIASIVAIFLIASVLLLFPIFFSLQSSHASLTSGTTPPGYLSFASSGQYDPKSSSGLNDSISLNLRALAPPSSGNAYYAWLLPDQSNDEIAPLLLGKLAVHAGGVQLEYNDPQHKDLLTDFSGMRITEQPDGSVPPFPSQDPKDLRYSGEIPNIPTPGDEHKYSLLSHIRHLLAKDPTLEHIGLAGGLEVWLSRNTGKVQEWASAARDQWQGPQTPGDGVDQIHRQMVRIIEYLDGQAYSWQDVPPGTPWLVDPLAGRLGLLNIVPNQEPAGYLTHVSIHLVGLSSSPGHTAEQQQLSMQINVAMNKINMLMQQVHQDVAEVVKMNATQLRQQKALSKLDEITSLATEVQVGQFDPHINGNTGGIIWIEKQIQKLAVIPIYANGVERT